MNNLFAELKRRNVLRVAAAYLIVGWLVLQIADIVLGFIAAPDWVGKLLITLLVLGFVPVIAVAWIFELTPEGVQRESRLPTDHQNHVAARRLDYVTIGAIVILAFITFYQQFRPPEQEKGSESFSEPAQVENDSDPFSPKSAIEPTPFTADPQSIAVLPFTNRSAEQDTRYFVDGIHDDLLTQLAKIADLTVISRTSVMEYRDTTKNLKQIGAELGVANILEGAVQKAGHRVRVNAQLIDADTDKHLWADSFDRELTADNLFDIQSDIARSIARALASTLTDEELDSMGIGDAPTQNQQAYDLYLQARAIGFEMSAEAPPERIELLKQAFELDPNFALAAAEIGFQYTNWYWFRSRSPEHERLGHEWLDKARAMDPDNPRIQWYWADHLYHGHLDYDGALAALSEAEEGLPNLAEIFNMRGWVLRRLGRYQDAIAAFERAVQLDPLDGTTLFDLSYTNGVSGNMAEYRRWRDRGLAVVSDPELRIIILGVDVNMLGNIEPLRAALADAGRTSDEAELWRFMAPLYERDYEAARTALEGWSSDLLILQWALMPRALGEAILASTRGDEEAAGEAAGRALGPIEDYLQRYSEDARAHMAKARALAYLGRPNEALAAADRSVALYPPRIDALGSRAYQRDRVLVVARVGDSKQAAAAVEELLETPGAPVGFHGLMLDPVFDRHRDHEAFLALERKYGQEGQ